MLDPEISSFCTLEIYKKLVKSRGVYALPPAGNAPGDGWPRIGDP